MRKSKYLLCFALIIALLLLATGCNTPNAGSVGESDAPTQTNESAGRETTGEFLLPDIAADYWEVFDVRCDVVYEPGFMSLGGIDLTLLSVVPLEQEDVVITLDTGWNMIYYLEPYDGKDGMCYMHEDLFVMYQGVTAEELLDYQAGTLSPERKAEIDDMIYTFRAWDSSEKPKIYRYSLDLCIPITEMDSNTILDAITIAVNGETRTYQLGIIQNRMFEPTEYAYDPNCSLNCDDNLGFFGANVDVTSDGSILLDNIKYTAVDDVVITGIRFYKGEDVQINSVSVVQNTADGAVIDTTWDMQQPIELNAGDSIYLNLQITDPFFAGTLSGWNARYLMLEYQCNGETFELGIPFIFVQSLHDPFAYIAAEDGLDVLTYYSH